MPDEIREIRPEDRFVCMEDWEIRPEDRLVCLEDWKIRLEETEDKNRVIMRITGRDRMGSWHLSSPVREVLLACNGWQVYTENSKEIYQLNESNDRIRVRGLWGSLRERWSVLAERLPEGLRLFAWLWEEPPELCLWQGEIQEDQRRLAEWSRKYGIGEDFQTLYLYCICIDKIRRQSGRMEIRRWQHRELGKRGGFFLCLNKSRTYGYEELLTDKDSVYTEWNYISQEIREGQAPLINVRANYECHGSPWRKYLVISYQQTEEGQIELVNASCRFALSEEVPCCWKSEEKKIPEWFLGRKLHLCNVGEDHLCLSGICGKHTLAPGSEIVIQMKEEAS